MRLLAGLGQMEEFILLESLHCSPDNQQTLLFTEPIHRLECTSGREAPGFLKTLDGLGERGLYWAGWFSYEFGCLLDPALAGLLAGRDSNTLARIGIFGKPARFDHQTGRFRGRWPQSDVFPGAGDITAVHEGISREDFFSAFVEIKRKILAGETYQINLSFPLEFDCTGDPAGLYQRLCNNQPVSYAAWIREKGRDIMSFSPELFFRIERGNITTRPMKGTIRRGVTCREDRELSRQLREDPKSRAENLMIVDLLRNDVARLLHRLGGGRVQVESLFEIEVFRTLLQMTSTISGHVFRGSIPFSEAMHALFPCGSVTGAPKIRSMEIIAALERRARGVYCGAIGHGGPDGVCLNVPIRTLSLEAGQGEMPVGAGIIHDSEAAAEWEECLLKGEFLLRSGADFSLVETMLWRPETGYELLQEHLARLDDSSTYFSFPFVRAQVEEFLIHEARSFFPHPMRVRLLLHENGELELQAVSFPRMEKTAETQKPIRFAADVTDPDDVFLYHKTTRRPLYDHYRLIAEKTGLFDFLFVNTRGEITEGTIANFFFEEEGCLYTPPLSCGLLPGTLRTAMLSSGRVREKSLFPGELGRVERLFLGNSIRGLVPVKVVGI